MANLVSNPSFEEVNQVQIQSKVCMVLSNYVQNPEMLWIMTCLDTLKTEVLEEVNQVQIQSEVCVVLSNYVQNPEMLRIMACLDELKTEVLFHWSEY